MGEMQREVNAQCLTLDPCAVHITLLNIKYKDVKDLLEIKALSSECEVCTLVLFRKVMESLGGALLGEMSH